MLAVRRALVVHAPKPLAVRMALQTAALSSSSVWGEKLRAGEAAYFNQKEEMALRRLVQALKMSATDREKRPRTHTDEVQRIKKLHLTKAQADALLRK